LRIVYVVGTRPNFVKMAPVIAAMRRRKPRWRHEVVHTGQHYDRMMSGVFIEELGVAEPDHLLGVGSGSHAEQTARVLETFEPVLLDQRPDLVLVPGDVNSTLAAALCAAKLEIAVGHVESGLRSFDRSMPESPTSSPSTSSCTRTRRRRTSPRRGWRRSGCISSATP